MLLRDTRIRRIVNELLGDQRQRKLSNRRSGKRHDFVAPVNFQDVGRRDAPVSGITVDLAVSGVSLVFRGEEPQPGEYVLSIHKTGTSPVSIRSELEWCSALGESWYSTGWTFLAAQEAPRRTGS